MKSYLVILGFALLTVCSCTSARIISPGACNDPKYLALKMKPIDSMTTREFEYYKMKDQECEQAQTAANAVEQAQIGSNRSISLLVILGAILVAIATISQGLR